MGAIMEWDAVMSATAVFGVSNTSSIAEVNIVESWCLYSRH